MINIIQAEENINWIWFYWELGFSIIPLKEKSKKPNISHWKKYQDERPTKDEIQKWIDKDLFKNIGIICGKVSGNLVVLDLDDEHIVSDAELNLNEIMTKGFWVVKTGGKGRYQIYCKHEENPGDTCKASDIGIEFRANGGYVVAVPSIHPSGAQYHFLNKEKPEELPSLKQKNIKNIYKEIVKKLREKRGVSKKIAEKPEKSEGDIPDCIKNILKGEINEGRRNDTTFILTHYYSKIKKMSSAEIKALLKDWNKRNAPPLSIDEINSVIESALKTNRVTGCNKIKQLGFCQYENREECHFFYSEEKTKQELLKEYEVIIKAEGKVDKVNCPRLAKLIMNEHNYNFLTMKETGKIYFFNCSFYESKGEMIIKNLVNDYLGDRSREHYKNEVVGYIRDTKIVEKEQFNPPHHLINLKNGILNLETNELRAHHPEYYFLSEFNIDYKVDVDYQDFEEFLKLICNNYDEVKTIQEYIGYMLLRDYPYKKFLILDGCGDNGKTTLMDIILNWIGPENNTSVSIQEANENRFAKSKFFGKHANISDDLPQAAVRFTGVLKQLTGNSPMWGDIKNHKEGISFINYAKPIYACNELPECGDETDAFFSRMISITLKKKFLPKDSPEINDINVFTADPFLKNKLSTPGGKSGILNFALIGLNRLMEKGHFTLQSTVEETRKMFTKKTNPTVSYVEEDIEYDKDWCLTCDDFYKKVLDYCDKNNLDHPTKKKVTQKLNQANLPIDKLQRKINDIKTRCWVGMRSASDSTINHYIGEKRELKQTDLENRCGNQ